MRLFLYEALSAGTLGPDAPASLQREGWDMLRAVAEDFARLDGLEVWTLLAVGPLPDLGDVCRRVDRASEPAAFRSLAAEADLTLVIAPESHGLLESRSQIVLDVGGDLLGSTPPAIRLTADKLRLCEFWQQRCVPTPATVLLDPRAVPALPAVCKPRDGAGSQATFVIQKEADWPGLVKAAQAEWTGDLIVQPWLAGTPASVALVLLGGGRTHALPAAHQHLSDDGRLRYLDGSRLLDPALAGRAERLAHAAVADIDGLHGYVGVDLILGHADDGSLDFAIEINPRLTTSYLHSRQ